MSGSATPVIAQLVEAMRARAGSHPGFRPVHAKGIVCSGTFRGAPQACGVSRAPQILDIIDVVRIDSDEGYARVCQKARRILGQERMPLEILRRVPVPGPAGFDQHGLARKILLTREARDIDRLLMLRRYLDGGKIRELLQVEF